ncbi:hypothetical protein PHYC_03161 [Phycisphaerales bacterium]|nr:hypothetical protein PHYC_03161 [Phycisphaerales bacterium]
MNRLPPLALLLLLAGCQAPHNERITLGRHGDPAQSVLLAEFNIPERQERPIQPDAASTPTLSRGSWQPTTVVVPVDGTYAYPRYARMHRWTRATSRQRGDPVSSVSALELEGNTLPTRIGETSASGPLAIWDGVLMIPRFFFVAPWHEVRSLPESYWRTGTGVPTSAADSTTP